MRYLEDEHKAKGYPGKFDASEWELVPTTTRDTPQQDNCFDCGVFTCTCADFLSVGLTGLDFDQSMIRAQRQRMVLKITKRDLLA